MNQTGQSPGYDPATGVWNDSLNGDFIWSNVNVGEAVADVMTPITWSIFDHSFSDLSFIPGHNMVGNICGRIYTNLSLTIPLLRLSGRDPQSFGDELGGGYEQFNSWIEQSKLRIPPKHYLPLLLNLVRFVRKQQKALGAVDSYLTENAQQCQAMQSRLQQIQTGPELADFWSNVLAKTGMDGFWMVFSSAVKYTDMVGKLRKDLTRLVGTEDAAALLSSVSRESELLASLGLVVGAWKVYRGEWTREEFLERYGHRSPFEYRSLSPSTASGTDWLDELLESYAKFPVDVDCLLAQQQDRYEAAINRLQQRLPGKARTIHKQLENTAAAARRREAVRSEFMRITPVSLSCIQKAGEFTGLQDDIYFLTYQEIWDLLRGIPISAVQQIPARRSAYERQRAMPLYPPVIRGQFHPDQWLADPNRRSDYYDAHETRLHAKGKENQTIKGMPGSAGQAEGRVRYIDALEHAEQLLPGEILVTSQTNVGWTPYFPRAAAVITDIGAPLSHAAIVARELGIPAVVGCRNATMLLKTGDRVRVDGGSGLVERIDLT